MSKCHFKIWVFKQEKSIYKLFQSGVLCTGKLSLYMITTLNDGIIWKQGHSPQNYEKEEKKKKEKHDVDQCEWFMVYVSKSRIIVIKNKNKNWYDWSHFHSPHS